MCSNNAKKIKELFQKVAKEVYNEKMKVEGKEGVADFDALIGKIPSFSPILCEDQYFGVVNFEQNSNCQWIKSPVYLKTSSDEKKQKLKIDREIIQKEIEGYQKNNSKTIAIVLESPHVDEFLNGKSIGPACGATGENLYKWLPEVLMNYVPCKVNLENATAIYNKNGEICSGEYKVKLINAIQYQCSLGEKTTEYRDRVFSLMWKDDVKASLQSRLKSCSPDIIINCCTKGHEIEEEKKELRRLVQKEINGWYKTLDCLLLRAAHPSSYHFKNGLASVDLNED